MGKNYWIYTLTIFFLLANSSCVTKRKSKQEVGFVGKKYHDMTARYNGYFNAKELYKKSVSIIQEQHQDNFSQILPIYEYNAEFDRTSLEPDMDKVIEKSTKVAALHEPSKWVDDCYVMLGKAQYLKGDLATAQETFEYFVSDFNPQDPDSRVYITPDIKETKEDKQKKAQDQRKIQEKEREQAKKEKENERKKKKKERDKEAKNRKRKPRERLTDAKGAIADKLGDVQAPDNSSKPNTNEISFDPDEEYIASFESKPEQKRPTELQSTTGGFLKHTPAYQEGVFWLAKTYVARALWLEANYYLDKLEKEEILNDNIKELTAIVRADYFMGQEDYKNALPALREAIDLSSDGHIQARMAFIMAQLYERQGYSTEAFAAFEEVKKHKPTFEMRLHADMNQLKNSWASDRITESQAISQLDKLARENKYAEFRGSIYSTMAEIKLAVGDEVGALEYFNKALESGGNSDRTEIYYRLATLYYAKDQFIEAKSYYDSTAQVMTERDKRKPEVTKRASSLTRIALNLQTIIAKDSLISLSKLSDKELRDYAENIAKESLEEKAAKENPSEAGGFSATTTVLVSDSKFFAYNASTRDKGFRDFVTKWGNDRTRENNWRRRNRTDSRLMDLGTEEGAAPSFTAEDLDKEVSKVLRDIPRTAEELAKVDAAREKALFELGTGFRNLIENYEKSTATLNKLLDDYPNSAYKAEIYFYQHLNYVDLDNKVLANEYFNKLMEEFPTSDFAQYLKNPNAKNGLMTEKRKVEVYYELTYDMFTSGQFDEAYERLNVATTQFKADHHMVAKYDLLKAMVTGKIKGQDEYINALRGVILKYNNTPEQTYARELMRFIKGDESAFGKEVTTEDLAQFILEDDRLHYVIMVVYDTNPAAVDEVEKLMEAFNEKYYKDKRLRQASIALDRDANSHLVLIRRFNNKDDAMVYFNNATRAGSSYVNTEKYSYELFAVNQKNYREIIQQKNVNSYRNFFELNYLQAKR